MSEYSNTQNDLAGTDLAPPVAGGEPIAQTDSGGSNSPLPENLQNTFTWYYTFYVAFFPISAIFFPIICNELSFSAEQIAHISLAGTLATIAAPPILQYLAHHWVSERRLYIFCLIFDVCSFGILSFTTYFWSFLFIWSVFQIFFKLGVMVDAHAIEASARGRLKFEHARMWGSVGFTAVSIVLGYTLDLWGTKSIFIGGILLLLGLAWGSRGLLPVLRNHTYASQQQNREAQAYQAYSYLGVSAVLCVHLLSYLAHASLYLYLSLYLAALGWSKTYISMAWSVGVISEILLFLVAPRLFSKPKDYARLFCISALGGCLRWFLLAHYSHPICIILAQALHSLSFGGIYISGMRLVYFLLPVEKKHKGQGYLQVCGTGIGLALGQYIAGVLAASYLGYQYINGIYNYSCLASAIALGFSFIVYHQVSRLNKGS